MSTLARAGTLAISGVYPRTLRHFPIGESKNRNPRMKMGNCPHRRYMPILLDMVEAGAIDPGEVITERWGFGNVLDAYRDVDRRELGWIKVVVVPQPRPQPAAARRVRDHRRPAVGS